MIQCGQRAADRLRDDALRPRRRTWRVPLAAALCVGVLLVPTGPRAAAQPHADVPIRAPIFMLDPLSPTIGGAITPSAVLTKPGPMVLYPGNALGLNNPADELDAIAFSRGDVAPTDHFIILFGVDRMSTGAAGPDPQLVSLGRPFNMTDQAQRHQAAGDVYLSTNAFNRFGPIPGLRVSPDNNTLGRNGGDTGGVDQDLEPTEPPIVNVDPGTPQDDMKGCAIPGPTPSAFRSGDEPSPRAGVPAAMLFFSATRNSPSLATLPGMPSGANIYVDFNPEGPGGEQLYAQAGQLGLVPGAAGDDINAFMVFDVNFDGIFQPGVDEVIFSLARGSPSLGAPGRSPADLYRSQGFGNFALYAPAQTFGLALNDNIDGVELMRVSDLEMTLIQSAVRLVIPGDVNTDNLLDETDWQAFGECHSGPNVSYDFDGTTTVDVIVGPGPTFEPQGVVVEVGDTVRWTWAGGIHNVVSGSDGMPDGAFYSGPPNGTPGATFSVVFDEPLLNLFPKPNWVFPYYCGVHFNIGSVQVVDDPCATFDRDFDGDVDCYDWRKFQELHRQLNGQVSVPLTILQFVDALLGFPHQPHHLCWADMNLDGLANGRDVREYIFALLGL